MAQLAQPQKPAFQEPVLFDLQAVVRRWAGEMFRMTRSRKQAKIPNEALMWTINFADITVVNEEPQYKLNQSQHCKRGHALFVTEFRNKSDSAQSYTFSCERSTSSTAEIEIETGYTTSQEVGFTLKLPGDVFEANAGFQRELSLTSAKRQSVEETLTWNTNTEVQVKPRSVAEATVNIEEEKKDCEFTATTSMRGELTVTVTNRQKNNEFIMLITGDLGTIVEKEKAAGMPRPSDRGAMPNVWTEPTDRGRRVLYMQTSGKASFRYGVRQFIDVSQKSL